MVLTVRNCTFPLGPTIDITLQKIVAGSHSVSLQHHQHVSNFIANFRWLVLNIRAPSGVDQRKLLFPGLIFADLFVRIKFRMFEMLMMHHAIWSCSCCILWFSCTPRCLWECQQPGNVRLANLHKYEAPYFTLLEMSVRNGMGWAWGIQGWFRWNSARWPLGSTAPASTPLWSRAKTPGSPAMAIQLVLFFTSLSISIFLEDVGKWVFLGNLGTWGASLRTSDPWWAMKHRHSGRSWMRGWSPSRLVAPSMPRRHGTSCASARGPGADGGWCPGREDAGGRAPKKGCCLHGWHGLFLADSAWFREKMWLIKWEPTEFGEDLLFGFKGACLISQVTQSD